MSRKIGTQYIATLTYQPQIGGNQPFFSLNVLKKSADSASSTSSSILGASSIRPYVKYSKISAI